jgi:hypothetical protein
MLGHFAPLPRRIRNAAIALVTGFALVGLAPLRVVPTSSASPRTSAGEEAPALDASAEVAATSSADAARLERWRRAVPLDATSSPQAPTVTALVVKGAGGTAADSTLELDFSGEGLHAAAPDLFFESHDRFALGRPQLSLGETGIRFRVPFHALDTTRLAPAETDFAWTLTGVERNGSPLAFEGSSRVALTPASRLPLVWLWVPVALVAFLFLWAALRSRRLVSVSTAV